MFTVVDFLKTYALFLLIDIVYLSVLRGSFMKQYFSKFGGYHEHIMVYGAIAWALLAFGLEYFVISQTNNKYQSFIKGALLGLVIYGVYDFTNMATIKRWTTGFVVQDVLWGVILCGSIAYIRN